jgi:hypothetical protein
LRLRQQSVALPRCLFWRYTFSFVCGQATEAPLQTG